MSSYSNSNTSALILKHFLNIRMHINKNVYNIFGILLYCDLMSDCYSTLGKKKDQKKLKFKMKSND